MTGTSDVMDLQDFCARVLREYEDVIATIIQRPWPPMSVRSAGGTDGAGARTAGEEHPALVEAGMSSLAQVSRMAA